MPDANAAIKVRCSRPLRIADRSTIADAPSATIRATAAPSPGEMAISAWRPPKIGISKPAPLPSAEERRPHQIPV
jgi:hypothetical protein